MKNLVFLLLLASTFYSLNATNFQVSWTSTTVDDPRSGFGTVYTLVATNPSSATGTDALISAGVRVVIDFPAGTDVSGLGQGSSQFLSTFNGNSLLFANVDVSIPEQVSFDAPVGVAENEQITVILHSIGNPVLIGTYTDLEMNIPNNSGGLNTFDMSNYTIICGVFAGFSGCDTIFAGQSIQLTDQSAVSADNWVWNFPGGTPSSFLGENPPPITYATAGDYEVEQIATNNAGVCADTVKQMNCVHVLPKETGPGTVRTFSKISDTEGNFNGGLENMDNWGWAVSGIGDLDGDGTEDLATGAFNDDDGALNAGAVYILFMNKNGTVNTHQKISATQGGFGVMLDPNDDFGNALTDLGDLDDDGVTDLAVGAYGDDDNCISFPNCGTGAVYVLLMNSDGTVKSEQKISALDGGLVPNPLSDFDNFGHGVAGLGDLDGDGVEDIAIGSRGDDDGGGNKGAFYTLFLNTDGTVNSYQKVSETTGGFGGSLVLDGRFGSSIANIGDIDNDGVVDLAVGAPNISDNTVNGSVWILFMNTDGTVRAEQEITEGVGGFTGDLDNLDFFATSILGIGDLDCNGVEDIAVGAYNDLDGIHNPVQGKGAIWILFLNKNGTVKAHQKISATAGCFNGSLLDIDDAFGFSLGYWREKGRKKRPVIITGAVGDDDGSGIDLGANWVLTLNKKIKFIPVDTFFHISPIIDLTIKPNPARQYINIATDMDHFAPKKIELFNMSGRSIITSQIQENPTPLDVSWLQPGIYMVKITSRDRKVVTKKVVIE